MPLTYNMGLAAEVYGEKGDPTYLTVAAESVFPWTSSNAITLARNSGSKT